MREIAGNGRIFTLIWPYLRQTESKVNISYQANSNLELFPILGQQPLASVCHLIDQIFASTTEQGILMNENGNHNI